MKLTLSKRSVKNPWNDRALFSYALNLRCAIFDKLFGELQYEEEVGFFDFLQEFGGVSDLAASYLYHTVQNSSEVVEKLRELTLIRMKPLLIKLKPEIEKLDKVRAEGFSLEKLSNPNSSIGVVLSKEKQLAYLCDDAMALFDQIDELQHLDLISVVGSAALKKTEWKAPEKGEENERINRIV